MTTEERTNPAARLGVQPGQVVQEIGHDNVDLGLREAIEEIIGQNLIDHEYDGVADVVLLWFRDDDGDLTDALVDVTGNLAPCVSLRRDNLVSHQPSLRQDSCPVSADLVSVSSDRDGFASSCQMIWFAERQRPPCPDHIIVSAPEVLRQPSVSWGSATT